MVNIWPDDGTKRDGFIVVRAVYRTSGVQELVGVQKAAGSRHAVQGNTNYNQYFRELNAYSTINDHRILELRYST